MSSERYDTWAVVRDLIPPLGEKKFVATAEIHEIGKGKVNHGLGEVWGKSHEEANEKMLGKIQGWIQQRE